MPVECICQNPLCSKTFIITPYRYSLGEGKHCSRHCRDAARFHTIYVCQNPACGKSFYQNPSKPKYGRAKYCSKPCWYACVPSQDLAQRFWSKVAVCTHGRDCIYCCWPWQGACNKSGHGIFHIKKDGIWKHFGAHIQAWQLLNQQAIPNGLMALHRCNYSSCVNNMHIYAGTRSDNARDALAYGSLPHHHYLTGEAVNTAKLTAADIPVIRQLRAQGMGLKEISIQFSVSIAVIHKIAMRQSWKHIP